MFTNNSNLSSKLKENGKTVAILGITFTLYKGKNILKALVGDLISSIINIMLGNVLGLVCDKIDIHMTENA